jgi:hypothetical protein
VIDRQHEETMPRPAGCRCTHETGDSACEVHPTCACCGEPVLRLGQACSWECVQQLRPAWAPLLQALPVPEDRPPPTSMPGPGALRELPDLSLGRGLLLAAALAFGVAAALAGLLALGGCGGAAPGRGPDNGDGCQEDADCASGHCLRAYSDGYQVAGGVCSLTCPPTTENPAGEGCPPDMLCTVYRPTQEGWCLPRCGVDAHCRTEDGWRCSAILHACLFP